MPGGDGTGPDGKGPITGRGTGRGSGRGGYKNSNYGTNFRGGGGKGRGMGQGVARPMQSDSVTQNSLSDKGQKEFTSQVLVDKELCTGCGICEDACPSNAISINRTAEINPALCTGCGICVNECPVDALSN